MPKASDLKPTSKASILLKSPFGFGKTIAACSMAVDGPIFLAYWDKKEPIELLAYYKKHRPEVLKNIEYEVYGANNANEFLNFLIREYKNPQFYGIINDSVTFMTTGAVNWSMGFRDPKGGQKDKVSGGPKLIPDFDEYKVETSLVTQCLDICKELKSNTIWTAHPLPSLKVEGSGNSIRVSTVKNIVSYGQKVGAMVPGGFTEVYNLGLTTDYSVNPIKTKRVIITESIGEDFAKTSLGLPRELDITNKLFWEVWKEALASLESSPKEEEKKEETSWKPVWKQ